MANARLGFLAGVLLATALPMAGCARSGDGSAAGEGGDGASSGAIKAGLWTILDTRTDLTDRARAKQNVEDALIRYPNVGCLVGLWSYNGPAILSAVKSARKEGQVPIVCFDEEEDTLQGVADGHIFATVVQQPFEFGYQSVRVLAALARGDRSVVPEGGVLDIPVQIIRKDDVTAFKRTLDDRLAGGSAGASAPPGAPTIAFVTNNVSDFWKIARAGVNKGIKEFGVNVEFQMPSDGTPAEQQRIVEALIAKKVGGMAISPNDAKNQIGLLDKAAAAMNVITQDSDAPESKRLCYVGTDNYKAGREAGKLLKEVLPNGGSIVIFVGRLDAQNARDRRQGIIDELSGKP
jgi:ribose transport system substrate-binding protein